MDIPVLVEPHPAGFQASTHSPVPMAAEGATEEAAVAALTTLIADRLRAGGNLRTISVTNVDAVRTAGEKLVNNPFHAEWLRGLEEYRREHNTVEESD